jgi:hypothetical protein
MSLIVKDQEMIELKEFIEKKEWNKAEVHLGGLDQAHNIHLYNMGYLQYKQGNYVESKYLLEKAIYTGLFSKEADSALKLVRQELSILEIEESLDFYDELHLSTLSLPGAVLPTLIIISLIALVTSLYKRALVFIFLSSLVGIAISYSYYDFQKYELFLGSEDQSVYLGPSKIFEQLRVLPKGLKYSVSKEVKNWKFIHSPKEFQGWVYKSKAIKYELP